MMRKRTAVAAAVLLSVSMGGAVTAATAADAPAGASSCSGCHPAARDVDTPVPRLIGRDPAQIIAAVQAFRTGQRPATVMDRVAKGFSDDEIKAIADWYGAQKD
jgi:sulfide dehydrogenase cytochrome subunit